ncbi:serine/threonine protein kinase [Pseudobdellovibrio exovorus]|uniref:Protein kinase domain-containing protein n=1 Tax=Pseudobdellovibrio exovorus JSS TaxID=1184267 RepID=M4VSM5_9BACT|nr:serine/threonine-protein kinase [Pseudobdellovibrio exovorus]AGH96214.1 hypothetical protein A11Q_1998 [Pseudobdellovibrio exovorus JSS]
MSQSYEQFGKYLLLEKVAAGGMAEIYLARSGAANGLNKFFAIKRILPQFSNNEEFVSMFKEEAKVAINLNHSNVVSIFDFGIESGQFFLVMDYVEGRNLRQIINELKKTNKSFSIDQALYLIKEAAAGLDHAHRCTDATSGRPLNITHRDMSPQNIMVSFEAEVKVIDFGIAKAETEAEDTKAGTLKGKFSYMSPEQAEGQPIDPRTDVFALGIVLWELLANDRLFTGSNEAAILRKVRDCQVPPIRKINPTVPQELERIVMKALAKDRNVRYQTAANLHRDLNRFLNTQYPDFSPQDFSHFLKESFKNAFQDGRDKLVSYSKIVVQQPESILIPKATPAPRVVAVSPTPANPEKKAPVLNNEDEAPQMPNGFAVEPNLKISLDGLRSSTSPAKNKFSTAAKAAATNLTPNTSMTQSSPHQTRVTQVTQATNLRKTQAVAKTDYTEVIMKVALVAVLAFGGWWGYQKYMKPAPITRDISRVAEKPTQKIPAAAITESKVSLNSSPDGAEVFLNGQPTGLTTPALITVTAKEKADIVLRKEGYIDYTISRSFSDATAQVSATMQVAVATAYLNIKVSDGNSFTKISINGKELLEKPPILKYPIVAQKETVISAFNPITKLSDEVRINAKPGESVDIQLILGRRQPASKK